MDVVGSLKTDMTCAPTAFLMLSKSQILVVLRLNSYQFIPAASDYRGHGYTRQCSVTLLADAPKHTYQRLFVAIHPRCM